MSGEPLRRDDITEVQIFVSELFDLVSGGPLESQEDSDRMLALLNYHLSRLVSGGRQELDGSIVAQYEAFVPATSIVLDEEGELSTQELEGCVLKCTLQHRDEGFDVRGFEPRLIWQADLDLENSPRYTIFCTTEGFIGHVDRDFMYEVELEKGRGLIIAANNLCQIFSSRNFVTRTV